MPGRPGARTPRHGWQRQPEAEEEQVLIECDRCVMRDIACDDCVVTALLDIDEQRARIGEPERRALRVLADARMVAPLRLRFPAA
jgi:hypothetical protein